MQQVLFLESFEGLPRPPEIQAHVAARSFGIANQLGSDVTVASAKEPCPITIRSVRLLEGAELLAADAKFPHRCEASASLLCSVAHRRVLRDCMISASLRRT